PVGEGSRARRPAWSAEAALEHQAEASLPHSTIPLARLAEDGDTGGEGNPTRPPPRFRAEPLYPYQAECNGQRNRTPRLDA
ncbi:hypothetical protein CEN46_21270, partial [Fischerella thermalis CCMEE 5318]